MYHTHSYTADGEEHLQLPQYMYNGSLGTTTAPQECPWYDLPCKFKQREDARKEALTRTLEVQPTNKGLLIGMGVGMLVVFGVGAYFLLK